MVKKEEVEACLVCNSSNSVIVETTKTMMGDQTEEWTFKSCQDCSFVFLSPRVNSEDLGDFYTTSYLPYRGGEAWGKYSKLVEDDLDKIDERRTKIVKKYFDKGKSKNLLDIGCGKPSFLKKANELLSINAYGLDFSDEGWKDDMESYKALNLYIGEVSDLSKDIKADVITMWHYLEHDYNPQETLRQLSNSQSKGTTLVVEVPNYDSYTRKKYGKFWSGYHTPRHTGLYSPETMKHLLESCRWEVEEQYTFGTLDPYTLDWMSRMEAEQIDWSKSMESHFFSYVLGKIMRPKYFFHRQLNLGFMTTIARNIAF